MKTDSGLRGLYDFRLPMINGLGGSCCPLTFWPDRDEQDKEEKGKDKAHDERI